MSSQNKDDRFGEIDRLLREVRDTLNFTNDASDANELVALQMLLQVTKELFTLTDFNDLVTKILDSTIAFVNGERAFIMLLDENGEPRFELGRDVAHNYLTIEDFSPSTSVLTRVLETRETLVVPDAQADEILSRRDSVRNLELRIIMCAPMMVKREIIGLLYVDSSKNALMTFSTKANVNFLASLADQAAVAVRNAQKFQV